VTRFAVNRGYSVAAETEHDGCALLITSGDDPGAELAKGLPREQRPVILVASDRLGDGPEELGRLLMKNFIITLLDLDDPPDRMFFVNTGVLLASEGSEVLDALEKLGNRGVEVLSCGVCLDFFHRKELLRAGQVTNMFTIAESMMKASTVIRP
jgi:selenium metabolism protein YedF